MEKWQPFGSWFQRERKARCISQKDVAERVGVSITFMSKMENDVPGFMPSEETVVRLADALAIDRDYALARAGKVATDVIDTIVANPILAKQIRQQV